ncbi:MAG: translation initiation factor IF-2 [Clostridiales bacterium]|nr:translation initiation factor IF-2 [Clostridiales bacterium]
MVTENKSAEVDAGGKLGSIKKVNALAAGSGKDTLSELGENVRTLQNKIEAAVFQRRELMAERERQKRDAAEAAKPAAPVKKAKPAPPPIAEVPPPTAAPAAPPAPEPVVQKADPIEAAAVKEDAPAAPAPEKPAPEKTAQKPAPEPETKKAAPPVSGPAAAPPANVRTRHFGDDDARRSAVPSYIKGQFIPTPPPPRTPPGQRPPYGQSRPPLGAGGQRPPFGQRSGAPGQQGGRPGFGQRPAGQGGQRPPSLGPRPSGAAPTLPQGPARKGFDAKKKDGHAKADDKKTMNKRTLIRKGFITEDFGDERMGSRKLKGKKNKDVPVFAPIKIEKAVITTDNLTVKILSEKIGKTAQEIIKQLMILGIMTNINSVVDFPTMELVANELGVELELKLDKTKEELVEALHEDDDDEASLVKRPPIITVMGHVDHGKTSLLDAIRKTAVAEGEAGGITQHIGAYSVMVGNERITFLDTPGHEAFTEMRARGAKVTDIAILIVAADDGVMPQTVEALHHAKAAGVPIIVAVNKIDKPGANPDKIKQGLIEHGVVPEEWGGDTMFVPLSAKTGEGIDKLLETILFLSEYNNYRANPDRMAKASIIESRLDKGRGPVANVVVLNGTLRVGDYIVSGYTSGRIRAMTDDKGRAIKSAPPSTPVSVLGFTDVPGAGDQMFVVGDEKIARQMVAERTAKFRTEQANQGQKITLDDVFNKISEGQLKDLNLIVKGDVQGSVEALSNSLVKLSNDEVKVNVVHGGVGAVNKSDLMLAGVSGAIIVGFNVRPDAETRSLAESTGVDIRLYNIIYEAIDDITAAIKGMVAPKYRENIVGRAQVRSVIKISGVGVVAGSYILNGKITRNAKVRVFRDDVVIHEGTIAGLRRFKDDVKEVAAGYECGITLDGFSAFIENDEIEAFVSEEIKN